MKRNLSVVLVGCGTMSGRWLEVATAMDGVEVVGLVDLEEAAARERMEEFGLSEAVVGADLAAILQVTNPDMVFDCAVPEAHEQVTLTALEHGCHVLGEKPLANSMEAARRMVAAAEDAGKLFAVVQNRRYDLRIRRLARFLSSGLLGRITTVNSDFYVGAHFGGFRDHMEHVLLLDMAIHTFDQVRFLTRARATRVFCKEWNPPGSWYEHDASAVAVFDLTDDIVYTYRGSWCAEGLNTNSECDWRIVCERGSVLWDGGDNVRAEIVTATGGFKSETTPIDLPPPDPCDKAGGHEGLIHEFVHCVRTGEQPETAASDNIHSLAMVFGAVHSAGTGSPVAVD